MRCFVLVLSFMRRDTRPKQPACSGQKCSAQSVLFVHENWSKSGILDTLKGLASQRNLRDLTASYIVVRGVFGSVRFGSDSGSDQTGLKTASETNMIVNVLL